MLIRINTRTINEVHNLRERLKGIIPIETFNYDRIIEILALGFDEKTLIKHLRKKKEKTYNFQTPGVEE